MTDDKCIYHKDGYCLKGLDGTPCEREGCIAHIERQQLNKL